MQSFRDLKVWQKAHQLTLAVYRTTGAFPSAERFGVTSQLRRACASIGANLAEGACRRSDRDFARFVEIAVGSASEVEYFLLLARDLDYLPDDRYLALVESVCEVKRMLTGFGRRLRSDEPAHSGRRTPTPDG